MMVFTRNCLLFSGVSSYGASHGSFQGWTSPISRQNLGKTLLKVKLLVGHVKSHYIHSKGLAKGIRLWAGILRVLSFLGLVSCNLNIAN